MIGAMGPGQWCTRVVAMENIAAAGVAVRIDDGRTEDDDVYFTITSIFFFLEIRGLLWSQVGFVMVCEVEV